MKNRGCISLRKLVFFSEYFVLNFYNIGNIRSSAGVLSLKIHYGLKEIYILMKFENSDVYNIF